MTIIVEDGSGVALANSYITAAEITAYLTDRGRQTENSWSTAGQPAQEAAAIKAADHVEKRYGMRFLGTKWHLNINAARSVLTLTENAESGDTVTLGSEVYTFDSGVDVGDTIAETLENLITAVEDNEDVALWFLVNNSLIAYAKVPGTAGDGHATETTITGAAFSFATTRGGSTTGEPQPLSFPRNQLYDRNGRQVFGVPAKLKHACAEYAVRTLSAELVPDPAFDASGRVVVSKTEKVGPIEESTQYQVNGAVQVVTYPAVDALLAEYLAPSGGVMR